MQRLDENEESLPNMGVERLRTVANLSLCKPTLLDPLIRAENRRKSAKHRASTTRAPPLTHRAAQLCLMLFGDTATNASLRFSSAVARNLSAAGMQKRKAYLRRLGSSARLESSNGLLSVVCRGHAWLMVLMQRALTCERVRVPVPSNASEQATI